MALTDTACLDWHGQESVRMNASSRVCQVKEHRDVFSLVAVQQGRFQEKLSPANLQTSNDSIQENLQPTTNSSASPPVNPCNFSRVQCRCQARRCNESRRRAQYL
jgi:hypothetical protein